MCLPLERQQSLRNNKGSDFPGTSVVMEFGFWERIEVLSCVGVVLEQLCDSCDVLVLRLPTAIMESKNE